MSCSISFHIPKALPPLSSTQSRRTPLFVTSKHTPLCSTTDLNPKTITSIIQKPIQYFQLKKSSLALQVGAILATVEQPAFALTGVNNEQELSWVLIQLGVVGFFYFLVMPPVIMNWLRLRFYKRKLLETYLQFMFVFIFFPGLILWAPFLNFRKFPRDPSMKYPWSKPSDPSKIRSQYYKYPYAEPEDYL
ncbi:NAD(P)H-quinone oxidoreductase subunit L, chloroplastic isoform X2 [Humulus lupulus]|uniref:NAD(P)H-quinone oxidoreductase subunit L, chloroplastic isoform X2 n=1 Tax=Humulus lupulus TaxID=3486 RepID=UPI002B4141E7|nr:NAD(P)H-quinone oxidoreductase subunit L, chloroplastic isoform X2 [Humulus lupulus]